LSGLRPFKDIDIKITGLRPGEKLYEETLLEEEGLSLTANDKIFVTNPVKYDFDELTKKVEGFIPLLEFEERELIIQQIESLVWSYTRFEDVKVFEEVVS
jgi:FlaA1/EpsC-like NDP-sugar epimerase